MSGEPGSDLGGNLGTTLDAAPSVTTGTASGPRPPVDLRLVAVTPDRSHLVLEGSDRQQFRVALDARLVAALRGTAPRDRARTGQLEIALESQLTPREIQARIRSGHSIDEVTLAAGISTERVERYASPVLAERQHVVEAAQRTPGRRASAASAPALGDLVAARLAEQHTSPDAAEWDAWRAEEHEHWTVRVTYLAAGRTRTATWSFDPRGRVLSPTDDEARWLVDDRGGERDEDAAPAAVRRLASVPAGELPVVADPGQETADEVYDREADELRSSPPPSRETAAGRAGRRPAVPSFDDIMFGPRRGD